jgi:hypothetical protein
VQDQRPGRAWPSKWLREQDHEDEDLLLINNRQNGRRRGRGGGGPRPSNQGPNMGNRQDNRSRGTAAQLLEKYKSLARDAQLQGDRVQSEYWLQFADHYYRVLNENRARFEEQPRGRDDYGSDEEEDQDEGMQADDGDERDERPDRHARSDRPDRQPRDDRPERHARDDRPERQGREDRPERQGREDRPERQSRDDRGDRFEGRERPRREFRDRDDRNGERPERMRPRRDERSEDEGSERIALDVLPPAISVVEGDAPAKPPRRRARPPRADEGEADIAPAA